jgi:hypothetical protein
MTVKLEELTSIELPDDKVYDRCKTALTLDHAGHIAMTLFDVRTGEDIAMVYLGKEIIQTVAKMYAENKDLVDNEGKKKDDVQSQAQAPITQSPIIPIVSP